jgi:hypothetical protein
MEGLQQIKSIYAVTFTNLTALNGETFIIYLN